VIFCYIYSVLSNTLSDFIFTRSANVKISVSFFQGTSGLPEAICEIKKLKEQIKNRERLR